MNLRFAGTLALTLSLSPKEREQQAGIVGFPLIAE